MEFVYKPIKKEILNTTTPAGGLAVGSSVQVQVVTYCLTSTGCSRFFRRRAV